MMHARRWKAALLTLPGVLLLSFLASGALAGSEDDGLAGVTVSVDAASYPPGDPITATVTNGSGLAISPMGGIVCQGTPWPFRLQSLDADDNWQDVTFARTPPCIGIATRLLPPGESMPKTFAAVTDPGQYRVVFPFLATDGTEGNAASDPFVIGDTPGM